MNTMDTTRTETGDSAISAEISRREDEWMAAWLRRDMQSASNILADEFTLTSSLSTGELMTKAQWLAGAVTTHVCQAYHFDRIDVRVYGEAALASGRPQAGGMATRETGGVALASGRPQAGGMAMRETGGVALANVWYHQQATVRGGDWSGDFLMSDLWVRRDGRWQVVARHASWLKPAGAWAV